MYLARLNLNTRSRPVRRDLANVYEMHRTVLSCFPVSDGATPRRELAVLYRIETNRHRGQVSLLLQAKIPPDVSRLPPGYLAAEGVENPVCKRLDEIVGGFHPGDSLRFRLRANATRRLMSSGKRIEVVGSDRQIDWLRRKAESGGFEILNVHLLGPDVIAMPEGKPNGWRPSRPESDARRLTFASVLFEGTLTIRDAERFRACIEHGVGSGKAFGFGLLSVAPAGAA